MINVDKDNLFVGDVLDTDGSVKKFFIECYSIVDTDYEEYEKFKQQLIDNHAKLDLVAKYMYNSITGIDYDKSEHLKVIRNIIGDIYTPPPCH